MRKDRRKRRKQWEEKEKNRYVYGIRTKEEEGTYGG